MASSKGKKGIKIILTTIGSVLALAIILLLSYQAVFAERVLLNSYFNGENISGKLKNGLASYLANVADFHKDDKIKLVYNDKNWELSFADAGWKIDEDKTKEHIFGYGREPNFFRKSADFLKSVFVKRQFEPVFEFNEATVENWLGQINDEIGTPGQEANIQIKDGEVKIIEPEKGRGFDRDIAKQKIYDRLALTQTGEIKIDLIDIEPKISVADAEALKDKAKELTANDVELVGPKGSTDLTSGFLGTAIELKRKAEKKSFLSRDTLGSAYVSFNEDKIRAFLQGEANDLNKNPVDAELEFRDGKVTVTQSSSSGEVIIIDDSVSKMVSSLEQGGADKVVLPTKVQEAAISIQTAADVEKYGIEELIGTGTTSFARSPRNRIHNIQNGVKYISGAIIAPGEEFSTLRRLGSIDQSTGYLPELVIKEDKTIPEFGGGLCQVSTTLFRAAMNSGLKITARQNHSYRVSYYEPPVGMDATIYSPAPDLKFVNNTSSYILIQGHTDGADITFDFYGKKDGRTVEITDPVVYDITSPPDSIYTDDPSLAPGEVKQIDRAHPGSKASFLYRVTKDDKTAEQEFKSYYVPWPARYMRGPGEAPQDSGSSN